MHGFPIARWLGAFALLTVPGSPSLAHGTTAGDLPVRPEVVRVTHRSAADIVALFAFERLPEAAVLRTLRGARAGGTEALLPAGVDGVLRDRRAGNEVVVAGLSDLEEVERCIQVLDAPVEASGPGRVRTVLKLDRASAGELRHVINRLPGGSPVVISGHTLTLEGRPDWLHRALRCVIRAELNVKPPDVIPTS